MGYLLISSEVAMEKGLKYFETMPDGRAILDYGMLRVLGSVAEVELVGSAKTLKEMIKAQEASGLYNQPEQTEEDTTVSEEVTGESVTENGEVTDNGESAEGEAVVETEEPVSEEGTEEPVEDEAASEGDAVAEGETVTETETNNEEELNNE